MSNNPLIRALFHVGVAFIKVLGLDHPSKTHLFSAIYRGEKTPFTTGFWAYLVG